MAIALAFLALPRSTRTSSVSSGSRLFKVNFTHHNLDDGVQQQQPRAIISVRLSSSILSFSFVTFNELEVRMRFRVPHRTAWNGDSAESLKVLDVVPRLSPFAARG